MEHLLRSMELSTGQCDLVWGLQYGSARSNLVETSLPFDLRGYSVQQ